MRLAVLAAVLALAMMACSSEVPQTVGTEDTGSDASEQVIVDTFEAGFPEDEFSEIPAFEDDLAFE